MLGGYPQDQCFFVGSSAAGVANPDLTTNKEAHDLRLRSYSNHCCFCRIPFEGYQGFPLKNAFARIESQNRDGHFADVGNGLDERSLQPEVVRPIVLSWIEEPNEFTGFRKDGTYIRSLVAIAKKAGKCQIVFFSGATMFQADYMIDFTTKEGVVFVDEAVLAESIRTRGDQPPERFTDGAATH
jgi:hypothetical protein